VKRTAPQISDIQDRLMPPGRSAHHQAQVRVAVSDVVGAAELGWYRGNMMGHTEAYLLLKKKHPEAASMIKAEWVIYERGKT